GDEKSRSRARYAIWRRRRSVPRIPSGHVRQQVGTQGSTVVRAVQAHVQPPVRVVKGRQDQPSRSTGTSYRGWSLQIPHKGLAPIPAVGALPQGVWASASPRMVIIGGPEIIAPV